MSERLLRGRRPARVLLAACAWLLASGPSVAADVPDPHAVLPERPTVATHAHTVAPGWLELEAGVEHDRAADRSVNESAVTTAKLGLTSHTQLGVTLDALRDPAAASRAGFGDLSLALKCRLLDAAPWLGDFALIPAFKLPLPGALRRGTSTGTTDGSLLLVSSHAFGSASFDANLGGTFRSGDGSVAPVGASLWAAALGLSLSRTLGWAAELYGLPGTRGAAGAPPLVAALLGPTWTPRPWLELDAGAIVPITGPQPHAWYAGGVWNVGRFGR